MSIESAKIFVKKTAGLGLATASSIWIIAGFSNLYSQYSASGSIIDPGDCFLRWEIADTVFMLTFLTIMLSSFYFCLAPRGMWECPEAPYEAKTSQVTMTKIVGSGLVGAFVGWLTGSSINYYSAHSLFDRAEIIMDDYVGSEVSRDALIGAVLFMTVSIIYYAWNAYKKGSESQTDLTTQEPQPPCC